VQDPHAARRPAPAKGTMPLPTRERRPGYVALAVALIVGFAAVGAFLYVRAGAKTLVVVVVAQVPAGHVIARSDLSSVAVAGGVTAIAAEHVDSVVGQAAAVQLLPNMLLQRSMVATTGGLSALQAGVGVVVKSGQIPADGLAAGDTVEVVRLPPTNASVPGAAQVLVMQAEVYASRADPAQAGGTLLTLVVPLDWATSVAAASGAGLIALIKVKQR
jgi:hypothetical protein